MEHIRIRHCIPDNTAQIAVDLSSIRAIALATWPIAYKDILVPPQLHYMLELMYSEAALWAQVKENGHHFILAELDGTAVGFAAVETQWKDTGKSRLHKLYVLPEVQGKKVGVQLLESAKAMATTAKDTVIELNVNRFNKARYFYEAQGFHVVRDEVIDIGQGYVMDDHVMELSLDQ